MVLDPGAGCKFPRWDFAGERRHRIYNGENVVPLPSLPAAEERVARTRERNVRHFSLVRRRPIPEGISSPKVAKISYRVQCRTRRNPGRCKARNRFRNCLLSSGGPAAWKEQPRPRTLPLRNHVPATSRLAFRIPAATLQSALSTPRTSTHRQLSPTTTSKTRPFPPTCPAFLLTSSPSVRRPLPTADLPAGGVPRQQIPHLPPR
jgi:hypothetical protein